MTQSDVTVLMRDDVKVTEWIKLNYIYGPSMGNRTIHTDTDWVSSTGSSFDHL